ncbi:hypothetical protein D3C76_1779000 [compost metagenome]
MLRRWDIRRTHTEINNGLPVLQSAAFDLQQPGENSFVEMIHSFGKVHDDDSASNPLRTHIH